MPNDFGINGVEQRILALDEDLQSRVLGTHKIPVIIVGSSALMLLGLTKPSRVTEDIDLIDVPFEANQYLRENDMNDAADTFLFQMPAGWRDRAIEIPMETEVIEVITPSPEDLAIMKLHSGREADINDVRAMLSIDPSLSERMREILHDPLEMQINVSEEEWEVLKENFDKVDPKRDDDHDDR